MSEAKSEAKSDEPSEAKSEAKKGAPSAGQLLKQVKAARMELRRARIRARAVLALARGLALLRAEPKTGGES